MEGKLTAQAQNFVQQKGSSFDPTESVWGSGGWDAIERKVVHGLDASNPGFAAVGYKAWHDLGTVMPAGTTAQELLEAAGLNWAPFHAPLTTTFDVPLFGQDGQPRYIPGFRDENGERVQITERQTADAPDLRTICRMKDGQLTILGTSSARYGVIPHVPMFTGFADALYDQTAPTVATAGELFGGRKVFMCWRLPEFISIDGVDDTLQLWLLAMTSHDRSAPATVSVVPVRTVCWNTSRWNIRNAVTSMTIRHTSGASVRLDEAREALGMSHKYGEALGKEARILLATPMSAGRFQQIVTEEFGPKEDAPKKALTTWDIKMGELMELWQSPTQDSGRGTAWGALNVITEYQDWKTGFKKSAEWAGREAGGRFFRAMQGHRDNATPKQAMVSRLRRYANIDERELVTA